MAKVVKNKSTGRVGIVLIEHVAEVDVVDETGAYEQYPKVFFTNPPLPASTGAVIDAEQGPEATPPKTALKATPDAMVRPESPEK